MPRKTKKLTEGKKMPETADYKAWKQWFGDLKKDDHKDYLSKLGLDDEDIEEWEEDVEEYKKTGHKFDEGMQEEENKAPLSAKKPTKKAKKK